MATPLLTTKLYIPPVRPELVPRPRLIERLNTGLVGQSGYFARKLTLVSAPAGFGKTTLLSEWAAGCGRPVAWLSLDRGDNDPARFWAYFIAALQTVHEGVGDSILAVLHSPQPPPIEAFLTGLINEITEVGPASFVFVLDDYHVIKARSIHDALGFLLDHLPPHMHLVIATRADPPLPIARLRGRGQLTELRLADLRFTLDEVTGFLNQVMGVSLSAGDVTALASCTEGWIAGLQMATLAMQARFSMGQEDTASFIRAFGGSDRYILDYLVEEVLQRQAETVQTFLFQTAILDRLTGPLCDAVCSGQAGTDTDQGGGQAMLERLERANLFIVPLDNERRWYRYHRLFADLLQQRLHQMQPDRVPTLHLRASGWYERNGLMVEAIDHAFSAGDLERAACLIEQAAEATLMRSEVITLLKWVEALPEEQVTARPALCTFHAWALLLSGHPIDMVESRLRSVDEESDLPIKAAPLRAFVAVFRGQLARAAELSHDALEQLPDDDLFLRSTATWTLAISGIAGGDVLDTDQALDDAARVSQEVGDVMGAVITICSLAELHMTRGELGKAKGMYQRALELATDKQGQRLPIAGMALIGLGELSRERNDLESARRHITEGIERIGQWGEIGALDGYIHLAHTRQAQGDVDGAHEAIQKAQQLAIKFDATDMDDILVAAHQVFLWVAQSGGDQGLPEAAVRWVEERGLTVGVALAELEERRSSDRISSAGRLRRTVEYLAFVRVLMVQRRLAEALAVLDSLLAIAEQWGLNGRVIRFQILRALVLLAQGDITQALSALERALLLAEPEGYVRIFVDEGEPMAQLLHQAAAQGIAVDYVSGLQAALEGETQDERRTTEPSPLLSIPLPSSLIEPLSERELDVLRLLPTHLSSTEIAEELRISANTVRYHIKNIYGKLGVHRRSDAVDRAEELELL